LGQATPAPRDDPNGGNTNFADELDKMMLDDFNPEAKDGISPN